jgi:4-amino-4-deoxy-L-arabinose transferase-like glycosyltransferase
MPDKYKKHIPLIYFLLLAFIVFANNGNVSLWDQDEAAYAGFANEMIKSENWLIPDFMWSEIHRKPPLHFWNICLSYKIFGINEFSVRFPSAFFLLLTYILVYRAGTPLFGRKNAFIATVVLSTSLFVPSLAKISVTDATLLFFSTVCAFALLNIVQQKSLKWTLAFWFAFSMGILTKGPPIIIFTGVFVVLLFIFHPNRKNLFSTHPWIFLPLACLPLFLWGYLVSKKDGGVFISWMIDWYILKRVNSSVLGQTGPPGTHLLSIFVFFIPYFMFLPKAFWNAIRGMFLKDKGLNFLLSTWFISGWFLYEWSPSKLPAYVIAAHVPFAILIAKEIMHALETRALPPKGLMIVNYILAAILFSALIVAPQFLNVSPSITMAFTVSGAILLLSLLSIIYLSKKIHHLKLLLGCNILFQVLVWIFLLPKADELKDGSKRVAAYATRNASARSTVLIANTTGHPPSLPFYLKLNFTSVEEETNMDDLISQYQSNAPVVLILNQEQKTESEQRIPGIKFGEVRSMLTDRDQQASYYIAINNPARLK